jgi:hypothetical protein
MLSTRWISWVSPAGVGRDAARVMRGTRSRWGSRVKRVNWVLDADVRDFVTTRDHDGWEKFLGHRITDQRVLRLISTWLNTRVIEDGTWSGTPEAALRGASVSGVARSRVSALRLRLVGSVVEP